MHGFRIGDAPLWSPFIRRSSKCKGDSNSTQNLEAHRRPPQNTEGGVTDDALAVSNASDSHRFRTGLWPAKNSKGLVSQEVGSSRLPVSCYRPLAAAMKLANGRTDDSSVPTTPTVTMVVSLYPRSTCSAFGCAARPSANLTSMVQGRTGSCPACASGAPSSIEERETWSRNR